MTADAVPKSAGTGASDEERRTRHVRDMGRENGLFRGCMDQIKGNHERGQALRNAMLAAACRAAHVHVCSYK